MNIYAKHGSKERLFEMFQNVNKIKLNEEYEDLDNSDLEIPLDPKAEKEANAQMKQHYLKQYSLPMDQYKNPTEKWNKHTLPYDTEFSSDAPIKEESEGSNLRAVKVTFANGNTVTTSMAAHLTDDEIKNYYKIGKQFNLGSGANGVEDNMQPVTNVEILKEQGMNEGKPYVLGKGYTHFAVGKNDNKIYDGWDYKGYDQDELRQFKKDYFFLDLANNFPDIKPQDFKILTRNFLERNGINPTDTNNWYKLDANSALNTPQDSELPIYEKEEMLIDNIGLSGIKESTDQEKYENVVSMQGDDAFQPLEILDSDGPEAALEYLKQWHYPGEHEGSNELGHGTSDEIFEKDGYIMSWNPRIGYIGLQYDLEHDGGQSVDEGAYSKATRYNKNSIDAVKKRMNRKINVSKKKISEGEIEEPNESPTRSEDPDFSKIMPNLPSKEFDDKLQGGLGDDAGDQKFSADQIRKGLKVEMEHTDDPLVAMDICIDHLSEDPQYYGDDTQDPEQSAQCNAMADASGNQQDDGVNPDEPSDEVDILLGFKPHNVGDTMDEYDNYNYPAGADADPRAPWHEKDEPDDGKDHSNDEFEDNSDPEPEGDVYRNRY